MCTDPLIRRRLILNKNSKKMAVSGMMVALGAAVMLLGGVIPLATFCCPALAGLVLIPLVFDCGRTHAWSAWAAISLLGLMLCPDKEAALLFAFLGWYPVAKWPLEAKLPGWRSLPVKLLLWNACAGAMAAMIFFVFRMDQVIAEYREMSRAMLIVFAVLANVTLILYDRLLNTMAVVYVKKLRPKLFKG